MTKIIIFGGAFNPIHQTHVEVALQASSKLKSEVWFDVSAKPRWKSESVLAKTQRKRLVKAAIKDYPNLKLCEEVPTFDHVTYTIDTMLYLKDKYPKYDFYFLIGTDQVNKLHKWKEIDSLVKMLQFIYVKREGYTLNLENFERYKVKDIGLVGTMDSSSQVRQGDFALCPLEVQKIIKEEGLYYKEILRPLLSKERYKHSLRVARLAVKIARANKLDHKKAYIAALVHDCAKELDEKEQLALMQEHFPDKLKENPKLHHQYLGRIIAKRMFGIEDEEILQAIETHTTARPKMSKLAKLVYCADKVEPGRGYDSTFLTERCLEDLEVGFAFTFLDDLRFLIKKGVKLEKESDILKLEARCLKIKEIYLLKKLVKALDERFADNIVILDVEKYSPLVKYYLNCEAHNERQLQALAYMVEDLLAEYKYPLHHIEGRNDKNWILVDAFDVVINIFKGEERSNYNLEKIWHEAEQYSGEEVLNWSYTDIE